MARKPKPVEAEEKIPNRQSVRAARIEAAGELDLNADPPVFANPPDRSILREATNQHISPAAAINAAVEKEEAATEREERRKTRNQLRLKGRGEEPS